MMTFEEFSELLIEKVQELAEGKFEVQKGETIKNNGLKLTGVMASKEKNNISPVCYLEKFYDDYRYNRCSVDSIAEKIYHLLESETKEISEEVNIKQFLEWDKIKNHIFVKLINAELNKELLEKIPHKMFMDLAEVYYVKIAGFGGGVGTILIYENHCGMWKVNENILHEIAIANMRASESSFINMKDVLGSFVDEMMPMGCDMYILSNKDKLYGASEILKEETLYGIAEQIKDDFVILPSSVHEVIIMPVVDEDYKELADMVKMVNQTDLSPDEILSYHVYKYDRENRRLSIVQ